MARSTPSMAGRDAGWEDGEERTDDALAVRPTSAQHTVYLDACCRWDAAGRRRQGDDALRKGTAEGGAGATAGAGILGKSDVGQMTSEGKSPVKVRRGRSEEAEGAAGDLKKKK